jgi:hypothetical protein
MAPESSFFREKRTRTSSNVETVGSSVCAQVMSFRVGSTKAGLAFVSLAPGATVYVAGAAVTR